MNRAVRAILVVFLACVALLCIYVPIGDIAAHGTYAVGLWQYEWVWQREESLVPDIPRIALELVSVSAIAGAAVLLTWRRRTD